MPEWRGSGLGEEPGDPNGRQPFPLQNNGSGGYFCESCAKKIKHDMCIPVQNPNAQAWRTTQWDLPYQGHGFPRRDINITPQENLYRPDKILGGREHSIEKGPPGPTVLQQPRVETTSYPQSETVFPSPYRLMEPVLEKLQHIYPRFDSETVYAEGLVEAPAGGAATNVLQFDTIPGVITYLRNCEVQIFDGLVPNNMGVSVQVDGNPVKYIAQPAAATNPPTYGVQPATPQFPFAGGLPVIGNGNILLVIPDRKRIVVQVSNLDPIAPRRVCVSLWGWLTPFVGFGR